MIVNYTDKDIQLRVTSNINDKILSEILPCNTIVSYPWKEISVDPMDEEFLICSGMNTVISLKMEGEISCQVTGDQCIFFSRNFSPLQSTSLSG